MVERYKPKKRRGGGDYFPTPNKRLQFIPSGCALLDCVIGGGWPLGRTSNIVGDKSTGKTLLAIEACANFARIFPKGSIWYREGEAAFDTDYAAKLGLPIDMVDFGPDGIDTLWNTVEDVVEDIQKVARQAAKNKKPGLYIIDSLDSLSDRAEQERAVGEGSYGTGKAKMMSELFRRRIRELKETNIHLMVVSQIRDRIGVKFGEKHGRSGGHAMDFYASQVVWLHHIKTLTQTAGGIKRATAIQVKAKCKKNKIAMPFRECDFSIRFGYGIEDIEASLAWLGETKMLSRLGVTHVTKYLDEVDGLSQADFHKRCREVRSEVMRIWEEIEQRFLPERRKYAV